MRIQVRKCPFTGKIFEEKDKKKYIKHLEEIRERLRKDRELGRIKKTWKTWLLAEKEKISHVDQIPAWFLKNQRHIMNACNAIEFPSGWNSKNSFVDKDEFVKLEWEHVKYEKNSSNSHNCPEGGVTNWCNRDKNLPSGYKGFRGYLKGSLIRPSNRNGSYPYREALNLVGIKTGTGGGGNENFGYEFTVFVDDWPGLKEQVRLMEEDEIAGILKGKK